MVNSPVYLNGSTLVSNASGTEAPVSVSAGSISGTIAAGTNVNITGSGTTSSPYVINSSAASGSGNLPAGGSATQCLIKNSSTNYDASWYPLQVINQVYINYHNSTNINISSYDGQTVQLVDGPCQLSAQPFRIDNTGLSANTLYYLYGYRNGSNTLSAEWSTTYHQFDSASGLETKVGDTSRILLGMVKTDGSAQFVDSTDTRYVLSWACHNREPLTLFKSLPSNTNISGTGWQAVSGLSVKGLTWGYGWHAQATGRYGHSVAGNEILIAIRSTQYVANGGGTNVLIHDGSHSEAVDVANNGAPWSCQAYEFFLEGEYLIEVVAQVASGAGTLTIANYSNADGMRSRLGVYASMG